MKSTAAVQAPHWQMLESPVQAFPQRQARIDALTKMQDINRSDLSAFRARGGKLLMAHGTADVLVSTRATQQYYQRMVQSMGAATAMR